MKLRNKKTGEIIEFDAILPVKDVSDDSVAHLEYASIAELDDEWEDYEEPKEYWFISDRGEIFHTEDNMSIDEKRKFFGNYFETKEEAEKAVEKLKAWKRLKDKGFRFTNWEFRDVLDGDLVIEAKLNFDNTSSIQRDLEVCFGGEE